MSASDLSVAATGGDTLSTPSDRGNILRRFVLRSPQITIVAVIALVMLITLAVVTVFVISQYQASTNMLTENDGNRSFVQLQRETLRLLVLVVQTDETFNANAVQLQTDLVESRIGVINFPTTQAAFPPEILDRTKVLLQEWAAIKPQIVSWKADPTNATLREQVRKALTDFEFQANDTEVNYARVNTANLTDFAAQNQKQFVGFGVGALVLVLFVFAVATSIYRFNQQMHEVEAIRESNRLKDEFLAVVSHELRTPLNAIIGFLGIMKMSSNLSERDLHMVERSRANATRLLALINDILDISKIEAGKLELVMAPVSIRALVERWQSQMDVLAKQKGIKFNVHVADAVPEKMLIDEDAVTKISTNLLSNAFKFTEKGEVALDVRPGDANQWIISVQDTGVGIPENARTKIFESFRQVDNSIQRVYGGTGLGLSIVQRLCKAMGGSVEVDSVLGKGSTFTVKLPLKAAN